MRAVNIWLMSSFNYAASYRCASLYLMSRRKGPELRFQRQDALSQRKYKDFGAEPPSLGFGRLVRNKDLDQLWVRREPQVEDPDGSPCLYSLQLGRFARQGCFLWSINIELLDQHGRKQSL